MILKARHNMFLYPFFIWYSQWSIGRHFSTTSLDGTYCERHLPLLIISNHISWWDGFWVVNLNRRLFKRKFHFMMLEEQLRRHWYFNYTGGYSVRKHSRSALESIDYTAELLTDRGNAVLLFPQGEINSLYKDTFVFEKGIERILKKVNRDEIEILFMANMVDYLSDARPSLYQYIEEYKSTDTKCAEIEKQYNLFYRRCLEKQTKAEV